MIVVRLNKDKNSDFHINYYKKNIIVCENGVNLQVVPPWRTTCATDCVQIIRIKLNKKYYNQKS